MTIKGPLVLTPRLDTKVWGGESLARFGFVSPSDEPLGEAVITASEARTDRGITLGEIVEADPERAIGSRGLAVTGGRPIFPLLIKLIDANDDLSIQVHPDDDAAAATTNGQSLGKSEAWWVLSAAPGSALYLGLREGVSHADLAAASRSGSGCGDLMRRVPAIPNTLVYLPAGTVHALGAGVLVYEIQQPSAITYRLDDWHRVDASGKARELHIEEGLAVSDVASRPEPRTALDRPTAVGRCQLLISCRFFALERIALVTGDVLSQQAPNSPQAITVIYGSVEIIADGQTVDRATGQTAALLADATDTTLRAMTPAVVLRAWVPGT